MKSETTAVRVEDLTKLKQDVAFIKNVLLDEGKLTEWAKKELAKARAEPEDSYLSHEELKKQLAQR